MLKFLFWSFVRFLVLLRYRVTVEGAEKLRGFSGPALVLPNHPGYFDSVLVLSYLRNIVPLRPLVGIEGYRRPWLLPIMKFIRALEVPSLEKHSLTSRRQAHDLINILIQELDKGEVFMIYPSGRLARRGLEALGATRAVPDILAQRPATKLILVRTVGYWGSLSSCAFTGKHPEVGKAVVQALQALLFNFIFFLPRRRVKLTIEMADVSGLPSLSREHLYPFLESWYNRGLSTEPIYVPYVPYHFWFGPRTYQFPPLVTEGEISTERITDKTKQATAILLEEKLKRPLAAIENTPDILLEELGLDSIDRMELALMIEQRFGFGSDLVPTNMGQLWILAQGLAQSSPSQPIDVPAIWSSARIHPQYPLVALGSTIPEAFVRRALARPRDAIAADDNSGVVTYARMLVGAQLMAKRFAAMPGEAIGVMLPSSVAADMVTLALLLAEKLPVMLNWTVGPAHLSHAIRMMKLQRVITSQKLLDRTGITITGAEPYLMEDFRKSVSKSEAIFTLLRNRFFGAAVLDRLPKTDPDQPAVVLFTSGSEKAPKAVPLSHRNILTNCQAGAKAAGFNQGTILLAFLPTFHSFGLSYCLALPLVTGMRVVHHPDPTDGAALARKIAAYKATLVLTTPTFWSCILNAAPATDLASLRLVVTGAEKCSEALISQTKQKVPQVALLEGYGITECSPAVSVGLVDDQKPGTVGRPLDGVEVLVTHPETNEPLPIGATGQLLVRGPSVFSGYLHYDGASPFLELNGKQWYATGDLVRLDAEGFIYFQGRLKRFLKTRGEMISLPALEEALAGAYPPNDQGPQIAVEGVDGPDTRRIVCFTTTDLTLAAANTLLAKAGFNGIMRFDEVRRVEKIPTLGTGKTDYKILRAEIQL